MPKIDESIAFVPVNIAIMTVSDSRTPDNDKSGDTLHTLAMDAGHHIVSRLIVKDDVDDIQKQVNLWISDDGVDVILSTGGTGVTGRDVTPEALEPLYEKKIEGFGELFRMLSYQIIGTSTIQSRCTAGVANGTYIFALPGSPGACKDGWNGILKDQLDIRYRPCNFVEMMPRLKEHL